MVLKVSIPSGFLVLCSSGSLKSLTSILLGLLSSFPLAKAEVIPCVLWSFGSLQDQRFFVFLSVEPPVLTLSTLYRKSIKCISREEIALPQSQFLHFISSLGDLYIPRIGLHIFGCSKIDTPILEIYKILTDI